MQGVCHMVLIICGINNVMHYKGTRSCLGTSCCSVCVLYNVHIQKDASDDPCLNDVLNEVLMM